MDYREKDRFRKRNIELIQTELEMQEPSFCRELSDKMGIQHLDQIEFSNALLYRGVDVALGKFICPEGRNHLADFLVQLSRAVRENEQPVFSLGYHYEGYKETKSVNRVIGMGINSVEVEL
jgi:hypothetical protein